MPRAELPSSWQGWVTAIAASIVGFLSGFVTIAILTRVMGG